jgi:hypothetical protein
MSCGIKHRKFALQNDVRKHRIAFPEGRVLLQHQVNCGQACVQHKTQITIILI